MRTASVGLDGQPKECSAGDRQTARDRGIGGTRPPGIHPVGSRVSGVELGDGRRVRAPVVVSNADAHHTYEDLVGVEHLPERLLRRMRRLKPSMSAFVIYGVTSQDLLALGPARP